MFIWGIFLNILFFCFFLNNLVWFFWIFGFLICEKRLFNDIEWSFFLLFFFLIIKLFFGFLVFDFICNLLFDNEVFKLFEELFLFIINDGWVIFFGGIMLFFLLLLWFKSFLFLLKRLYELWLLNKEVSEFLCFIIFF